MKPMFATVLLVATIAQAGTDLKLDGLRERWLSAMKELDIPGAAVVVVRGDKVILTESLGVRNLETNQPVSPDTMFYIASCTKSYMAMAVLTLVEEGKIDLDAPVKKYLPQFQIADPELTEKLTIRDLLSHAKGLDSGEITFGEAYSGQMTEDRYWRMMKNAKAKGSFQYTNLHYTILGRVVEKVTGQKWQDYVEQHVCKSTGMNRTTAYASRMYSDPDVAIPTIYWDGKLIAASQRKTDRTMHAAGGMGSTANDLARWLILNLNHGTIDGKKVLASELVTQMQTQQAASDQRRSPVPELTRDGYGLGWEVGTYRKKKILQHGGGYVGTAALVMIVPDENIAFAVVCNTDGSGAPFTGLVMIDVLDRLLGVDPPLDFIDKIRPMHDRFRQRRAEQVATTTQPVTGDGLSLPIAQYAGTYQNDDLGTLTIKAQDGRLVLDLGDIHPQLFTTDMDQFSVAFSGGTFDGGRFEIADKLVKALILRSDDDEWRFTRE